MSLPVGTAPEADTQIREIDDWWRKNRRSSPDLFLDELASSFEIISNAPHLAYTGNPPYLVHAESCSKKLAITSTTSQGPTR